MYPWRIYWDGRQGCIKHDPNVIPLVAPPDLPGCVLRITELDYAPGIPGGPPTIAQLREGGSRIRDMNDAEIAACDVLLRAARSVPEG